MGRPLAKRQHFKTGGTWSSSFPSNLTYDLAGNVTSQTYPVGSSRKVNYEYDSAGRLSNFTGTLGGSSTRTYADQFSYWAGGQRKRERFGTTTNLYHNLHYNARMQLVDIRLSNNSGDEWNWNRGALITYYSATAVANGNPFENNSDNNGNVIMAEHYVPLNDAISSYYLGQRDYYTYDPLNRIQDVDEWQQNSSGSWSNPLYQKFVYDRWGNRTIDTGASFGYANIAFTVDTANNRLGKPGGSTCTGTKSGMCFDAAGNLTFDDYSVSAGGGERTYDAENRMATAAGGAHIYTYDANGQRTRRKISGTETWQVYGFGGELLAEYAYNGSPSSPQKEYGYRAGQLLVTAESSSNVRWTVADHLGTPRIVVALGGGLGDVTRHDYLPFGEESSSVGIRSYGTDTVRQKFVGYERDNETGLDFAGARYFSAVQGRFTSADNFLNDTQAVDPTSWNLYAYVRNNPLRYTDPTGEKIYAGDLSQADKEDLLKRTNFTYGCEGCVTVGKDGYLAVNTSGLSKEVAGATQYLTDAINSTDYFAAVAVSNNDKSVAFGQNLENGTTVTFNGQKRVADKITLDFSDDKAVSGDKNAVKAFLYTVFAHEVAHGYPNRRSDPAEGGGNTGPVVDAVNLILQARGLPLRERYSASPSATYWAAVPHGYADQDKKTGQIKYNQSGGIRVKEETKLVVRWIRNMVGGRGIN